MNTVAEKQQNILLLPRYSILKYAACAIRFSLLVCWSVWRASGMGAKKKKRKTADSGLILYCEEI